AVGADRHQRDRPGVPLERGLLLAGVNVPDPSCLVPAAGEQRLAVRGECHRVDEVGVAPEGSTRRGFSRARALPGSTAKASAPPHPHRPGGWPPPASRALPKGFTPSPPARAPRPLPDSVPRHVRRARSLVQAPAAGAALTFPSAAAPEAASARARPEVPRA